MMWKCGFLFPVISNKAKRWHGTSVGADVSDTYMLNKNNKQIGVFLILNRIDI